jgi:hypothetical protein
MFFDTMLAIKTRGLEGLKISITSIAGDVFGC